MTMAGTPSRKDLDDYLKGRGDGTRRSTDPAVPPKGSPRGDSTKKK